MSLDSMATVHRMDTVLGLCSGLDGGRKTVRAHLNSFDTDVGNPATRYLTVIMVGDRLHRLPTSFNYLGHFMTHLARCRNDHVVG